MDFPDNFIERLIRVRGKKDVLILEKSATSTFHEYTEENAWDETLLDDIYSTCKAILDYIIKCNSLEDKPYFDKKLSSLYISCVVLSSTGLVSSTASSKFPLSSKSLKTYAPGVDGEETRSKQTSSKSS